MYWSNCVDAAWMHAPKIRICHQCIIEGVEGQGLDGGLHYPYLYPRLYNDEPTLSLILRLCMMPFETSLLCGA